MLCPGEALETIDLHVTVDNLVITVIKHGKLQGLDSISLLLLQYNRFFLYLGFLCCNLLVTVSLYKFICSFKLTTAVMSNKIIFITIQVRRNIENIDYFVMSFPYHHVFLSLMFNCCRREIKYTKL